MFSNKDNINIFTALLLKHGVRHAVVCPGSRNAPIVHNLHEMESMGKMTCYPVTDERSAGFCAIGISQATGSMVAVCVTSGSALLNLAPAVAEAKYQHIPLIIISADRPAAWIDQLDGQTLPQPTVFGNFVAKCVSLPEPKNNEEHWHCNRLVNEALLSCQRHGCAPVHINVPISEPLFDFTVEQLPDERMIKNITVNTVCCPPQLTEAVNQSPRPILVVGQTKNDSKFQAAINDMRQHITVIQEPLSGNATLFDHVLKNAEDTSPLLPHLIIYIGDTLVSKPMRKFLRTATDAQQWRISESGDIEDCFQHLTNIIEGSPAAILAQLANSITPNAAAKDYKELWDNALKDAKEQTDKYEPRFSHGFAVRMFENELTANGDDCAVHYANSTAIRHACRYAHHYVYCNRGVNGIEGSLSTVAGFSLATNKRVYCVIGDLSFFYDQNALWNTRLRGNLRILLINDGRGGIFSHLPGLEQSPALNDYIAASHHTSAQGICAAHNITYIRATDVRETETAVKRLFSDGDSNRPILVEIILSCKAG